MNVQSTVLAIVIICMARVALAETPVGEEQIRIKGDLSAIQVCRAILDNDVAKLHLLLRDEKLTVVYGYQQDLTSDGVARNFTCNDMDLAEFSYKVGADLVSNYLSTGQEVTSKMISYTGQ